jgi:hypothetical protein
MMKRFLFTSVTTIVPVNLMKSFTATLSEDVSSSAGFADLKRLAFMLDGTCSAYCDYDKKLMSLQPKTEVNLNLGSDENHRKRIFSAKGMCQSFAGVVPLEFKQERVKNQVGKNPFFTSASELTMSQF